ncbi:MAG: hypothetical protein ACI9JL_004506 [Paracoccaceae bacterium]|jgi:hypothetical protein
MDIKDIKQNLTPGIGGAVAGAIVLAIVGFNWGGWVTGSSAGEMAQTAVLDRLVPICVGQFEMDTDKATKLAAMKKVDSWTRGDFVIEQGWATMPGSKEADSDIARDCADKITA